MQIKKIIIIALGVVIIFGFLIFVFLYKPGKNPEGLIFTKTFKNGLDSVISKEKYINVFKEAQKFTDLPIKYPTELPDEYKLFKVNLWNKGDGDETIEIYYDINKESMLEKNIKAGGGEEYSNHGAIVFNKNKKTILIKESIAKPFFLKDAYYLANSPRVEEVELINGKRTILVKYYQVDESSREVEYSNNVYLGYAQKNRRNYYYWASSNADKKDILKVANSIIKKEKQR